MKNKLKVINLFTGTVSFATVPVPKHKGTNDIGNNIKITLCLVEWVRTLFSGEVSRGIIRSNAKTIWNQLNDISTGF